MTLTGGTAPYNLTYSDGTTNFNVPNYNSNGVLNTGALGSTTVYNVVSVTDANGCPVENLGTAITITVGSLPTTAILSGGSEHLRGDKYLPACECGRGSSSLYHCV